MTKDFLCLDIESVPGPNIPEDQRPKFNEEDVKLGNLKNPILIAEKIEQARANFELGVDKQMATDPDFLMVCCAVAIAYRNGRPEKIHAYGAITDESQEREALVNLWENIRQAHHNGVPIVGYNSYSFDLPALIRRAMYQDIAVSPAMISGLMRRPEQNTRHYDLMQLLGMRSPFSGKLECKGLGYYLKRFGLSGKTNGMDGSLVFPMWKEGQHAEILEYCKTDVQRTAELFRRVSPWLVAPREPSSALPGNPLVDAHQS